MNFTELQAALTVLSHATLADPILALCNALAWLDPLITRDTSLTDIFYPLDESDDEWADIAIAWEVSRRCFPAVYAATTLELRNQPQAEPLAEQVCQGINQHLMGAEMHELSQIHWGLPFTSLALELHRAEFLDEAHQADLRPIYALLEVNFDSPHALPDNLGSASMVARVLAISLRATANPTHSNMAWLLDWMFAQTGNTVADYTDEEFYDMGMEPLPWEPDEIEFNQLMHTEALEIIGCAQQGLQVLKHHPSLQAELRTNARKILPQLRKVKAYELQPADAERLAQRLRWADSPEPVDADRTNPDLESLSFRGADAA